MAKNLKKGLSAILAALMCMGTMSTAAFAEETATTTFTKMKLEGVVPGSDGYDYMIAQESHENGIIYYETSNHTLEIQRKGAVHIFPVIDTTRDVVDGVWEADDIYVSGESNYEVVYCCDFATETREDEEDVTRTYYKRMNLEDSEYFSDELAERLRAIVSVSYPANSVEDAKKALANAGFEQAKELDRSELISATQGAIWRLVNAESIVDGVTDFRYRTTVSTSRKAGWGGYMHDYSAEHMNFPDGQKDTKITDIGARINALQDFFLESNNADFLANGKAEEGQIVISKLEIVNSLPIVGEDDNYTVYLNLELNYPVDSNDYVLTVTVDKVEDEDKVYIVELKEGTDSYSMTVEAGLGETIHAAVTGTQILKKGVYFYAPQPQDIDGDDIATSREVSQNLIGVGAGETNVYAEAEVVLEREPATGKVTLKKVDEKGDSLSGAEFELYAVINEEEILVGTYESQKKGEINIGNLVVGTYKLVETEAPRGYIGLEEPIYFEVVETEDGDCEVKQVFDEFELEYPGIAYEISNYNYYPATAQTFVLLNAEDADEWTYTDDYTFGENDYQVVYCGDIQTDAEDGTRYVKTALEECFDSETAKKLRAIIANSYPYVSMEEMIAAAAEAGVADAANLTRGDMISAVQQAIWHFTNGVSEDEFIFRNAFSVKDYPEWGSVYHDYSEELDSDIYPDERDEFIKDNSVFSERVRALYNYLINLDPMTAAESEINTFFYTAVGGKDVSQSLIGGDRTDFYTDGLDIFVKNIKDVPPTVSFESGDASNISFMLIDEEGKVEFLKKYDIGSETSYEIPTEEGKISAVFIKQSTSGMFWFAEEVDDDVRDAVIECLKENNPSYKGHNAIAFGSGKHDLEFKKGKFATYTFEGFDSVIIDAEAKDEIKEITDVSTGEYNEPVEAPTEELVPQYSVDGADIADYDVIDGITVIYIEKDGKVPAVIWTSEEISDDFYNELIAKYDVDEDTRRASGSVAFTFEYQHNKNKLKVVTYTFFEIAE